MGDLSWALTPWTLAVSGADENAAAPGIPGEAADADLVRAAVAGDRDAFGVLVTRHQRPILRLCARFVDRREDAADLAQDVFLRAFRALRSFRGRSSFATWLYRIAINVCLNRVASKAPRLDRMAPLDAAGKAASHGEDPGDALVREERARRVRAAIAQLPRKQRATLILRVYQDLSHEQIAEIVGCSVGACKANLFHALKKLRASLSP